MLDKNKDKLKRKERKTWAGLYTRKTPTKKTMLDKCKKQEEQRSRGEYSIQSDKSEVK